MYQMNDVPNRQLPSQAPGFSIWESRVPFSQASSLTVVQRAEPSYTAVAQLILFLDNSSPKALGITAVHGHHERWPESLTTNTCEFSAIHTSNTNTLILHKKASRAFRIGQRRLPWSDLDMFSSGIKRNLPPLHQLLPLRMNSFGEKSLDPEPKTQTIGENIFKCPQPTSREKPLHSNTGQHLIIQWLS